MFVSNSVMSFGELIRKCVFNVVQRIESSNNILIQCIILGHISEFSAAQALERHFILKSYRVIIYLIIFIDFDLQIFYIKTRCERCHNIKWQL